MSYAEKITVDGNQYACKRYAINELEKFFNGKIVALEDAHYKNMNLVDGILINVFDISKKNAMREKYMTEGKNYTFLDLSPEPVLIGYKELLV